MWVGIEVLPDDSVLWAPHTSNENPKQNECVLLYEIGWQLHNYSCNTSLGYVCKDVTDYMNRETSMAGKLS